MAYYQKRVPQIKATQWFKDGDHPAITQCDRETYCRLNCFPAESRIEGEPWATLGVCESRCNETVINEELVTPGDYIVEDPDSLVNIYRFKANVFEQSYQEIIPAVIREFEVAELKAFNSHHLTDDNGCPAGGHTQGQGFTIVWQDGALREDLEQQPGILIVQNGAFVEDVIMACRDRLEFYQQSKFACDYNFYAIAALKQALEHLNARKDLSASTADRESRGVEGKAII